VKFLRFLALFVVTALLGGAALGTSVALLIPAGKGYTQAIAPLGNLDVKLDSPAVRSVVYDRYGEVMTTLFTEDRQPVALKDIPQSLIDAVIAIEDRKFYEHNGVDYGGIFRALFKNVDVGGIAQGGSTITQQLVKNTMSTSRDRNVKTKVREATLAIRLENEMSKQQILERYLNVIYFGNGAYGVQAAAERYFNKPLQQLSVAESALLAGVIQSPGALDPITHPDLAARRRAEVLEAMVETGKLTEDQAREARSVPLPTKVTNKLLAQRDYYMDEVVRRLLNDAEYANALGPTPSARYNAVFRGGLKITTAYDPILQYVAAASVANVGPQHPVFTAAVVVIDNADGGVRATVAGKNFGESQLNLVTQAQRQAGSAFKVFTLAAALNNGYSPRDSVSGSPLYVPQIDSKWNPLRGDCHGGTPSLTRALAISDNCAWVRTELSLGPGNNGADGAQKVLDTAKLMGLNTSKMAPVVSTTLGTNLTSPLDMAQGYSVIAQDGVLRPARFITKIVGEDGKVLYEANTAGTRVLPENVARTEADMMKHVITEGTASGSANIGRPAAGKTGTTDNKADAWFVGFTPQLTTAVWMGDPNALTPMENVNGISVFGGTYPARIWAAVMKGALATVPAVDFPPVDRSQLPTPQYIDQKGRRFSTRYAQPSPRYNTPTTAPPVATTSTPTTVKRSPTTVVTLPPTSVPPPTTTGPGGGGGGGSGGGKP
jgi:penicillin-binding protein 1A